MNPWSVTLGPVRVDPDDTVEVSARLVVTFRGWKFENLAKVADGLVIHQIAVDGKKQLPTFFVRGLPVKQYTPDNQNFCMLDICEQGRFIKFWVSNKAEVEREFHLNVHGEAG